jgi:hypothetical protein
MPTEGDEPDLLSEISDFDLVRHLLADLHDDLSGKIARFRQLVDLSDALGSSGTMLFGGEITVAAWREARWSFIHGNFAATVLMCQGLVEHLVGSFLQAAGSIDDFPKRKRVSFTETLRCCQERNVLSDRDATDLRRLMDLRNPLSHFRSINDPASLPRRALSTMEPAEEHLRRDASFAIGLAVRLLALPSSGSENSRRPGL